MFSFRVRRLWKYQTVVQYLDVWFGNALGGLGTPHG